MQASALIRHTLSLTLCCLCSQRYFVRLHTLSSRPHSLLWLSRMFEQLILQRAPEAFTHCLMLGVQPLQVCSGPMLTCIS